METEQIGKRRRGHNYTLSEREILLELIKKNIDIIENKETNGNMMWKKRKAWNSTEQFNAVATSGPRTWLQLRHLYDNVKQRSKCNIPNTLKNQKFDKERTAFIIDDYIKELKNEAKDEVNKFLDAHIDIPGLSLEALKVKEGINVYNDTASFGDRKSTVSTDLRTDDPMQMVSVVIENVEETDPSTTTTCVNENSYSSSQDDEEITDDDSIEQGLQISSGSSFTSHTEFHRRNIKKGSLRDQYFRLKLSNTKLDRKFIIQRHKLELELLQLRLRKLKQYLKLNGTPF
ncbi:uncharacterized protein ACR2FA_008795 [Aphomia sociella]